MALAVALATTLDLEATVLKSSSSSSSIMTGVTYIHTEDGMYNYVKLIGALSTFFLLEPLPLCLVLLSGLKKPLIS